MLSTNPASGTKVNQGSTVTLTVSSGPANVVVPSLIGLSQAAAGQTLGSAGLDRRERDLGVLDPVPRRAWWCPRTPGTGATVPPGSSVEHRRVVRPAAPTTTTTTSILDHDDVVHTTTTSTTNGDQRSDGPRTQG